MNANWNSMTRPELHHYAVKLMRIEFQNNGIKVNQYDVEENWRTFSIVTQSGNVYDIKIKSSRNFNYNFIHKQNFPLKNSLFLGYVHFLSGQPPTLYLIQSTEWQTPNAFLVSPDYNKPGQKSTPEYGLRLSKGNLSFFNKYLFSKIILTI